MREIKQMTRGRKPARPLVSTALAERWEQVRNEREISVHRLPVSPPTYRKVINTGYCDQQTLVKLTKFFL
jgi:hypothetical protein